ncbi:MAG: bifunctional nuclease family protein [Pseudonocardiaceae bacterium]|nr:bifunctional nuclease family protein [Pseudonocardiaceae bacterium]
MREMFVAGLQVDEEASEHLLVLQEREGTRGLALWIGAPEAVAIAVEQQGTRPERPLTHNLLGDTVEAFGRRLEQVIITELREGTFFAELVFDGDVRVSARPSDSVAIALHLGVAIHAEEAVLDEAGVIVVSGDKEGDEDTEDEVRQFREFLDSATPEDFGGGSGN